MIFSENKPIYLQIAESIMDRIQRGDLAEGSRMPSVREYAADTGVNPNTVMRTYTWLQNESLISMKRGIGYFIEAGASKKISDVRYRDFFENDFKVFMNKLAAFGISPDQLKNDYEIFLKDNNKEF